MPDGFIESQPYVLGIVISFCWHVGFDFRLHTFLLMIQMLITSKVVKSGQKWSKVVKSGQKWPNNNKLITFYQFLIYSFYLYTIRKIK